MVVPGDFTQQAEILRSRLSEELTQETLSQIRSDIIELAPAFDKRMALEWTRWKRYGAWLSLIIMEVDQFEHINATLGHYSGDKVLKAMVVVLMRKLRATDFLARYGGGKFALLLPETSVADAAHVAHELRKAIEACNFHYDKVPVPVTLSCGVAGFHPEDTPEGVLRRAEQSLDLAKDSGRNRCCGEGELAAA
jgi:diguanylate cyclase